MTKRRKIKIEPKMNWAQRQRQNMIAFQLEVIGFINRGDIVKDFGVTILQASHDLTRYQVNAGKILDYNISRRRYEVAT